MKAQEVNDILSFKTLCEISLPTGERALDINETINGKTVLDEALEAVKLNLVNISNDK